MIDEVRKEVSGLVVLATEKIIKEKINNEKDKEIIERAIGSSNQ